MHATLNASVCLAAFLGLFAGAALSRANVCMLRSAHELAHGEYGTSSGLLAASAVGAVVFFFAGRVGWHGPAPWILPSLATVGGAALFAAGARLNAACTVGTVSRLAAGDLGALATIAGTVTALLVLPHMAPATDRHELGQRFELPWVVGMAGVAVALIVLAARNGRAQHLVAPVLLGAFAALLYGFQTHVSWVDLASDAFHQTGARTVAVVGIVALFGGALIASLIAGHFRVHLPDGPRTVREFGGGALMGAGALLIPGGTDALAFYGVPSGSPHAIVACAVLFGAIVLSFRIVPATAVEARGASGARRPNA